MSFIALHIDIIVNIINTSNNPPVNIELKNVMLTDIAIIIIISPNTINNLGNVAMLSHSSIQSLRKSIIFG